MLRILRSRAFITSFFMTLLIVLLIFTLLTVDARGRRLSFNDTAPPFEIIYTDDSRALLDINAFSLDKQLDVTDAVRLWHIIADFFCLPHRNFFG